MLSEKEILKTTMASFEMEGIYATEIDEKNIIDVLTGKRRLEDVIEGITQKYLLEDSNK